MHKVMFHQTIFWLFLMVLLISCQREDQNEIVNTIEEKPLPIEYQDIKLVGRIVDKDTKEGLNDVSIICNNRQEFSNNDGLFLVRNTKFNKAGDIIQFSHPGYFDEYRFLISEANDVQSCQTSMTKLNNPLIMDSDKEGNLEPLPGLEILIAPKSFVTQTGIDYEGKVQIFYRSLNSLQFVPLEKRNFQKKIFTNAMTIQIMALGENNEVLELKNKAQITTDSDKTIAFFNSSKALWEELKTTTIDSKQIIELTSLSLISIGTIDDLAMIEATLTDEKSNTLSNLTIKFETPSTAAEIQASQSGKLKWYAPADVPFELSYQNEGVMMKKIGSYTFEKGRHQLNSIKIPSTQGIKINSQLSVCNGNDLTEEEMVTLWISKNGSQDLVFYQLTADQEFYTLSSIKEATAIYYSGTKRKFSIFLPNSDDSEIRIHNDMPCIEDLTAYLKIGKQTKYFNSNQFQIISESDNAITITDNLGFILTFNNPVPLKTISPDILLVTHPKDIMCNKTDCIQVNGIFKELNSVGKPVVLNISGMVDGQVIEGNFNGILQ